MRGIGRCDPPVPGLLAFQTDPSRVRGKKTVTNRPGLRLFLWAALLTGGATFALAQSTTEPGGKKAEAEKSGETPKGKDKDAVKPKTDKPKLPPGTVILVPNPLDKTLSLWPSMAVMSLEEYQALKDQIESLKKQLKGDKEPASSCIMTGRSEGDYVSARAEFTFASEKPVVTLGLKGAVLTEKGDIDGKPPVLDYTPEEGFVVRDFGPGPHSLVLHFRVPVTSKRTVAGGTERVVDLGLPQTVITTFALELPPAVKEIRWNDKIEKTRMQGKWLLALGSVKTLSLSWREPALQPPGGPRLTVDGKIKVRVTDKDAELSAELVLEDPRGQTKECQLIFPPQADVKLEAPAGVAYELVPPTAKNTHHVLRFPEPNSERWLLKALVRVQRPGAGGRLPVGPFFVQGAEQQSGTITVATAGLRRQPLVYHLWGDVFQRDPPKDGDVDAVFQYLTLPNPLKPKLPGGSRVPLELEIKSERGALEAVVDQTIKLQPSGDGWEISLTAHVQVKSPTSGGEYLDLQLPRPRPTGVSLLATAPASTFPATLPWAGIGLKRGQLGWAVPFNFQVTGEGGQALEVSAPDASGRCRVMLPAGTGKNFALSITGKYAVDLSSERVRIGLPRPLGLAELGSKVTVQTDESLELLVGPAGSEEPVPRKHSYQLASPETPAFVDFAWRPSRPDFPVESMIDIFIHGRSAQVRQELVFNSPPKQTSAQIAHAGQVQCEVPPGVKGLKSGRTPLQVENGVAWVTTEGDERKTVTLEYDLVAGDAPADERAAAIRLLDVTAIWLRGTTHRGAKVRVWCDPGTRVRLAAPAAAADVWHDRGIEPVKEQSVLPSLVLRGDGTRLPLVLRLDENKHDGELALVCDRALIQASAGDDDSLSCKARYFVSRVIAETVDIEFPTSTKECRPVIRLNGFTVAWEPAAGENAVRVPLKGLAAGQLGILEIEYKLPASTQDNRWLGLATIYPPVFRDSVEILSMRWQYAVFSTTPALAFPISLRASGDYRWGLHGWLLCPEPSTSSAELETWLTGRDPVDAPLPVTASFSRNTSEPQRLVRQPRMRWVVCCSGVIVALFLGLYLMRLAWSGMLLGLSVLVLGALALSLFLPATLPSLLYGIQPGVAVILLLMAVHWLWQERYRRQIVFIPGFARVKAGSSLVRGSSGRRPREASTIDSPSSSNIHPAEASGSKK